MGLTQVSTKGIKDATILDEDINASAAIARSKLANVDLVDDTTPQLGGTLDTNGQDVDFKGSGGTTKILFDSSADQLEVADNAAITFGDHPDVSLAYNNGNDFSITGQHNGSGDIVTGFKNNAGNILKSIKAVRSSQGVELYYNDTKKFETTNSGGTLYGDWLADASFLLADSDKIKLGNAADLQIFHDSVDSYINNSTGTLYARGDTISLNAMSTTDKYFDATNGGAANLYHDNSKKLETTSTGLKSESSSNLNIHLLKTGVQDTLIQNTGQTEICAATGGASGQRIVFRIGANTGSMPEIARFTPDGLCFGSDTAAANALDDYEEGTHETTVTMSGDTAFTYLSRNLAYTKIGRVVHLVGRINLTGAGGSSFEFTLPFACADGSPDYQYETSNEFQIIRGDDSRTFRIREGQSVAKIQSDGSPAYIGASDPHINVNLTYFTST